MKVKLKQDFERLAIYVTPELYIGVFERGKTYEVPEEIGNYLLTNFSTILEEVTE